jgi:hypothetical protein
MRAVARSSLRVKAEKIDTPTKTSSNLMDEVKGLGDTLGPIGLSFAASGKVWQACRLHFL